MDNHRIARVALILLVLLTSAGLSASTLLSLHHHASGAGSCDVCLVGHMPWTGPAAHATNAVPVMQEWRYIVERLVVTSEAELLVTSTRAPPSF